MKLLKDLSDNASVESILADIPFFAVGLMAFGIFTFFLLIGAVSRWVVAIHLASVVAFVGSILDLSDILVHGSPVIKEATTSLDLGPLATAREILYAIANGILFGFLWLLVAQPPPNEYVVDEDGMHSGSWGKWGMLGSILKWGLAISAVVIAILQVLYRAVPAFHIIGPVYQVECTIRIIVSAVLLLKILLNTYLAVLSSRGGIPRWKTLRDYFPAMVAIGIGMGLAIADLVHFMLSSNILGTFLTGIEMYILLLYVLISSFYHIRHAIRGTKKNHLRSSSFNGLRPMTQQDYFLRISPGQIPQVPSDPNFLSMGPSGESDETQAARPPDPSTQSNPSNSNYSSVNEKSRRMSLADGGRASAASRLSAWLHPRNLASRLPSFSSPSPQPDDERLWGGDEAERGESPLGLVDNSQEVEVKIGRNSIDTGPSPLEPKESAKWQDPVFTSVLRGADSNSNFRRTGSPQSLANLAPLSIPPRAFARPMSPGSNGTDSPIYGLGGIIRARGVTDSPLSVLSPPPRIPLPDTPEPGQGSRATSISYLFREQAELDKTIANLKGLSISSASVSDTTSSSDAVLSVTLSEFSLSNFPAPPLRGSVAVVDDMSTILAAAGIAETPAPPTVTVDKAEDKLPSTSGISKIEEKDEEDDGEETETEDNQERKKGKAREPLPTMSELLPPQMPAAGEQHSRTASVPYSDDGHDSIVGATRVRMDSMGTQYEITSFIGDLTTPGQPQSSPAFSVPSSIPGSIPGSVSSSPLRALSDNPLTQPGTSPLSISPLTALQMSTRANLRAPPMASGQGVSGLPISRPMIGLPSGPRMGVRGALSPLRERMSPTEEFEHPRPAPVPAAPSASSPTGNSTSPRAPTP